MNQPEIQPDDRLSTQFDRIQRWGVIVAGAGMLLALIGAFFSLEEFFRAYLVAYLFWLGITVGSLAWLSVYHLTGGAWGVAIRRLLEANIGLTVLMALLFIPLLFGLPTLYSWARPEVVAQDALLQHKQPYLNVPFFIVRAIGYFALWIGLAFLLNRWSRQQEAATDPVVLEAVNLRLRQFGGPALALYGLSMTFAAFDWGMSLEPHWFSSIYGVMIIAGQVLAALAFVIIGLTWLGQQPALARFLGAQDFNDLGNFLLGVTLFWMYITFSQYLIIWSGNLPEEVVWYLARLEGGWGWVAFFLLLCHFALPFAVLLSARIKQRAERLTVMAGLLLVAELVNLYWLVEPAFHPGDFTLHWLHLVLPVAMGGLWLAAFVWRLRQRPLLPFHDNAIQELTFAEHSQEVPSHVR